MAVHCPSEGLRSFLPLVLQSCLLLNWQGGDAFTRWTLGSPQNPTSNPTNSWVRQEEPELYLSPHFPTSQVAMLRQSEVKVSSNLTQPLSVMALVAFKCWPCWSPSLVGIYQSRLGHQQDQTQWHARMSRMSHGDLALGTQCPWTPAQRWAATSPLSQALLIPSLDASPCWVPPDFPVALAP